jgi:hypothetical protein
MIDSVRIDPVFKAKALFLRKYVLNRAKAAQYGLQGEVLAVEAIRAWNTIEKELASKN